MISDFERSFWAVMYIGENRIVRIDSRRTRRIAVYESEEDALHDCDKRREEVVEIRISKVPRKDEA